MAEVIDRDSAAALSTTLRAGLAVVTHGFGDVNRYGLSGAVIVQLWHGAPLKKLHADSPAVTSLGGLERLPGASALMRLGLSPRHQPDQPAADRLTLLRGLAVQRVHTHSAAGAGDR